MKIAALVVTYNRKNLLNECLNALLMQTHPLSQVIVIDNNSTDGTMEWFHSSRYNNALFTYVQLPENGGGAAGFAFGLDYAFKAGYEKVWIMDDDAQPQLDALQNLIKIATSNRCIYGSLATDGRKTSWLTTIINTEGKNLITRNLDDIPLEARVSFLPFLGLLISREIYQEIGLPRKEFFLAADDVEYCMRAQRNGMDVILVGQSRIYHPSAIIYEFNFFGKIFYCLSLAPWKRYYDTRNRLLIAKDYYGVNWITQTIPGSFIRLLAALLNEGDKLKQLWSFFAGFVDGIRGKTGKRHHYWKINQ